MLTPILFVQYPSLLLKKNCNNDIDENLLWFPNYITTGNESDKRDNLSIENLFASSLSN